MVCDLHTAFVRAHNAVQLATHEILDFETKWVQFVQHANSVIDVVGPANFQARFSEENTSPALLEVIDQMVDDYNEVKAHQRELQTREHIENFDASIVVHDGRSSNGQANLGRIARRSAPLYTADPPFSEGPHLPEGREAAEISQGTSRISFRGNLFSNSLSLLVSARRAVRQATREGGPPTPRATSAKIPYSDADQDDEELDIVEDPANLNLEADGSYDPLEDPLAAEPRESEGNQEEVPESREPTPLPVKPQGRARCASRR